MRLGDERLPYYNLFHQNPMSENYTTSGHLNCPHCVFSDRNFIVPLLHTNVLLIEGHPFVYRYRRLPCGYTRNPFSAIRPTHVSSISSVYTSLNIEGNNERIYIIAIEGSKGLSRVEGYIY